MPDNNEERAPGASSRRREEDIESPGLPGEIGGQETPRLGSGWCPRGHWVSEVDAIYIESVPTCNVHPGVNLVEHP